MDVQARSADDVKRLERGVRAERDARLRERYRCVLLALRGFEAVPIGDKLGRSRRFVQYWVYRYRDHGLAGLTDRPRSGQPTRLPRADEDRLRARLDAEPRPPDGVCTLRGVDVVRILQEEFGVTYSLPGAYDLLHRLGYSYLRPRPKHRKNDPAALQAWLKDAPLLSRASGTSAPTRRSRFGSRMKPASGRKAR
jgi:transposase